jgi:hypothetical protein
MDAPNDRVAYDRDGSLLVAITDAGGATQQTVTTRQQLNSAAEAAVVFPTIRKLAVVFPTPHD